MTERMTDSGGPQGRARGEAGRREADVRSDLWVAFDPRERGGVELVLTSRVEPYYGDAIREQVRGILTAMDVTHARIEIDDKGALPFVIAARVEAAVRAAGIESRADLRPQATAPEHPPSERHRPRRSRLYLPGNEPKYFVTAVLYEPDGIILDLEDSVHPDHKGAARLLVRNTLRCVDFKGAERMVRINQLPLGLEDLAAVVPERPELVLIPKTESAEQVREVDAAIDRLLGESRRARPLWLMPIVETALGVEHAFEIASAGENVVALTIGLEDYAADLGVPKSEDGIESAYARTRLVNAARAARVQAIDSVFGQVDDLDGLREWAEESRQLGFTGMGCVHPRQIAVIHEAFSPLPEQLARARAIVSAAAEAAAAGRGVVSLGSKMIDPPVVRQAQRLVEQAEKLGILPPEGESQS